MTSAQQTPLGDNGYGCLPQPSGSANHSVGGREGESARERKRESECGRERERETESTRERRTDRETEREKLKPRK